MPGWRECGSDGGGEVGFLTDEMAGTTTVTDYVDVRGKIAELGCISPKGIALLPLNFESATCIADLRQASEAATIKKLFLAEQILVGEITEKSQRPLYIKNKSFEWVAPTLFISASLYSQNPTCVAVALNVLANYATEFFRGMGSSNDVSLNIVLEKKEKVCKKISYQGPVEGLKGLPAIIKEIGDE